METKTEVNAEIQRGWDILDSVTKYLIWMCPMDVYKGETKDTILGIREDYIHSYPKSFDVHSAFEQNNKWRRIYETQLFKLPKTGGML